MPASPAGPALFCPRGPGAAESGGADLSRGVDLDQSGGAATPHAATLSLERVKEQQDITAGKKRSCERSQSSLQKYSKHRRKWEAAAAPESLCGSRRPVTVLCWCRAGGRSGLQSARLCPTRQPCRVALPCTSSPRGQRGGGVRQVALGCWVPLAQAWSEAPRERGAPGSLQGPSVCRSAARQAQVPR